MLEVSNAIYQSDWYLSEVPFQKDLLFGLMNSQKEVTFTAGGMGLINRAAFTEVRN